MSKNNLSIPQRVEKLEYLFEFINFDKYAASLTKINEKVKSITEKEREFALLIHLLNKAMRLGDLAQQVRLEGSNDVQLEGGKCIDCKLEGTVHWHHVVPKSRGGTFMVPLCEACHSKVHHDNADKFLHASTLIREGIQKARERGVKFGRPVKIDENMKNQVIVLHNQGCSIRQSAKQLHVSKTTILRILQAHKIESNESHTNDYDIKD